MEHLFLPRPLRRRALRLFTTMAVATPIAAAAIVFVACGNSNNPPALSDVNTTEPGAATGSAGSTGAVDSGGSDGASVIDGAFDGEADDASVVAYARLPAVANYLAVGGSTIYASCSDGEIIAIAANGSTTSLATIPRAAQLTTVGNTVYVTIAGTTASSADGSIVAIDVTSHAQTTLVANVVDPGALLTNGSGVVYLSSGSTGSQITLSSVPFAGGTPTVLSQYASGRTPGVLVVDGSSLFFSDSTFGQGDIYTGGTTVTATVLATITGVPNSIVYDATNLYLTTSGADGTIEQVSRTNGTVRIISASEASPLGVQLIDNSLVWINTTTGDLKSYSLGTATETTVGSGFAGATATVVSDSLFVALADGTIVRASL